MDSVAYDQSIKNGAMTFQGVGAGLTAIATLIATRIGPQAIPPLALLIPISACGLYMTSQVEVQNGSKENLENKTAATAFQVGNLILSATATLMALKFSQRLVAATLPMALAMTVGAYLTTQINTEKS